MVKQQKYSKSEDLEQLYRVDLHQTKVLPDHQLTNRVRMHQQETRPGQ